MPKRPSILITNDDGITAPGLRTLIALMERIGDVVVVAPESPQSGMGHAITINSTLYLTNIGSKEGTKEYSCNGTPADCVKFAIREVMKTPPDLCVSGINHGSNASINVLYSGTMSAAIEAGIEGIPSVGFSLLNYNWDADFKPASPYVVTIVQNVLNNGLDRGVVLNVNIPSGTDIKGVKVCRQAKANWVEEFDKRVSPVGREYYWLTGTFVCEDNVAGTDIHALQQGYVSIVPTQFDLTAHQSIQKLNTWHFEL